MTPSSHRGLGTALLLMLLLATASCAGPAPDDTRERKIAELLERGKAALGRNEWSTAKTTFETVLHDYDENNNEARFGSALTDILFLSDILRYVGSLGDSASVGEFLPLADDESRYLTDLISGALNEVGAKFASADQHLSAVEKDAGFVFRIESLPLYLSEGKTASVDLRGEWDQADALFLHGIVKVLLSTIRLVDSVDLGFDFPRAHGYFTRDDFDASKLSHLAGLATYVLNDPEYPNFLSVKEKTGRESVAAASLTLASAFSDFERALYVASREKDDQDDDILGYKDVNGNGKYDPPLNIADGACSFLAERQETGDESKPESFTFLEMRFGNGFSHPLLTEQTLCLLEKLSVNLGWSERGTLSAAIADDFTTRPRINVLHDVIPVVDAGLAAVSLAYPKLTFNLPIPEGVLGELAESFLGDVLELDPEPFLVAAPSEDPGTLRGILPAWESYPCAVTDLCLNTFVIEMECSPLAATQATYPALWSDVFPELLTLPACHKAWVDAGQTQDTAHFGGALAADGFVGYLPYFEWQDPSFHGVIYLNVGAYAELYADSDDAQDQLIVAGLKDLDADPNDFALGTLAELNAFTAALSSNSTVRSVLFTVVDKF